MKSWFCMSPCGMLFDRPWSQSVGLGFWQSLLFVSPSEWMNERLWRSRLSWEHHVERDPCGRLFGLSSPVKWGRINVTGAHCGHTNCGWDPFVLKSSGILRFWTNRLEQHLQMQETSVQQRKIGIACWVSLDWIMKNGGYLHDTINWWHTVSA